MDKKIAKLEAATEEAKVQATIYKKRMDDVSRRLAEEKDKLRNLDSETKNKLQVNDTELPQLLEANILAKQEYKSWLARYETNKRYLEMMKAK